MKYSDEIDNILKKELHYLIYLKKQNLGPFAPNVINDFYDTYASIANKSKN